MILYSTTFVIEVWIKNEDKNSPSLINDLNTTPQSQEYTEYLKTMEELEDDNK